MPQRHMGNGCVAPLILNLAIRWEWPASHPSQCNPWWRSYWYWLSRSLSNTQSCLWQFAELNSTPSCNAPTAHQAVLHQQHTRRYCTNSTPSGTAPTAHQAVLHQQHTKWYCTNIHICCYTVCLSFWSNITWSSDYILNKLAAGWHRVWSLTQAWGVPSFLKSRFWGPHRLLFNGY
jgi:hypothetical protein